VLLENASVTTLSLISVLKVPDQDSRPAYFACEKYWPTMWRRI